MSDFGLGYIAAVREEAWEGSGPASSLAGIDSELQEAQDDDHAARLKRLRAASLVRASLSNGKLTIPREIVWLLQRGNEEQRDLTVVSTGSVVEIWPD